MTDYSHHIITAIKDRSLAVRMGKGKFEGYPYRDSGKTHIDALGPILEICHKFDVSEIIPILSSELTYTAAEANENNMLALPFADCFFSLGKLGARDPETKNPTGQAVDVGALCSQLTNGISVRTFALFGGIWHTDCYIAGIKSGYGRDGLFGVLTPSKLNEGSFDCRLVGPNDLELNHYNFLMDVTGKVMRCLIAMEANGIKLEAVMPDHKLNKAREKRGKVLLHEYSIVKIDPEATKRAISEAGGSHASPRLHWRRGHVRHFQDGTKTLVRACLVGDASLGMVDHDYKLADSRIN